MPPPRRHFRRPTAPQPPADEFCPEVPLTWQRALRKVTKLPRLNKMKITIPNERVVEKSSRQWLTKRGRIYRRVGLDPSLEKLFGLGPPEPIHPLVTDDLDNAEAQAQLVERFMKEILIETEKLAHWDDISQMELDSNQAVSPDMDLMMQNLFHRIAASSPESIESVVARTYRGTPEDDDVRSALAHEIAKNIIEDRSSAPLEAELSVQLEGPGRSSPDAVFRPSETDIVASHLARHMIQSISSYEKANSASAVSDIDASQNHSLVAQSLTHNILASKVVGGSSAHSMTHSLEQMPSKSETDGVAQRILEPRFGDSSAGSQGYSVGQAPSDAAVQGVAQELVVGMTQSDGHSQHGQMPEETLSDGYVANGIARDVIASAASQHMPAQQNDPSHITSEGVPFHTTQLVARETAIVQPFSFASSQPRDVAEQERSDANGDEEVRAILRQTVDIEAFGLPTQGKTPPSQQESAQADSEIAQSIARQIIPPHFGTEGSPREVQEQVQSDAEGYAAHAVARDFVASASKQLPEQRSNPPSQVHSEKTDSAAAHSLAREAVMSPVLE
eukprot:symbB.v1.2.020626.t1/scaffold1744.1/size103388/1